MVDKTKTEPNRDCKYYDYTRGHIYEGFIDERCNKHKCLFSMEDGKLAPDCSKCEVRYDRKSEK